MDEAVSALGMRPIGRSIQKWRQVHARMAELVLVMTYPHYLYLRDLVRPDRQIYFNIDDYSQYWPRSARRVNELERQAVREADLTVCVSRLRAEELRGAVPEATERIRHLPHGFPSASLAEHPWEQPAPAPARPGGPAPADPGLCRFARGPGRLGADGPPQRGVPPRLDRDRRPAGRAPAREPGTTTIAGAWPGRTSTPWAGGRRTLIHHYNRAFDVCLIPYRTDHPFNRACNPTKIMDYMGSGRPIVSTAVPECQLHAQLFHVAERPTTSSTRSAQILDPHSDDGRAALRHDFAVANTCRGVGDRILDLIS